MATAAHQQNHMTRRPAQTLKAFDGGRADLEHQALWAAALDRPEWPALVRQLAQAGNDRLELVHSRSGDEGQEASDLPGQRP